MDYKEWQEIYFPIKELRIDGEGGKKRTKIFEQLTNYYEANVWTIIIRNTIEVIVPGKKFVDAIGFIITKELHEFEDIFIQLNENKEMQEENKNKKITEFSQVENINERDLIIFKDKVSHREIIFQQWLKSCPINLSKEKDSLDMVKDFMILFNQPVYSTPTIPAKERMILRAKLDLEELFERVQASGIEGSFATLLTNILMKIIKIDYIHQTTFLPLLNYIKAETSNIDKENVNLVEVLDALLDQRYILDGAIHEYGMEEMFRKYFPILQASNMSKVCNSEQEAKETCVFHEQVYGECYHVERNGKWFVYEKTTNKAMKSINYTKLKIEL